MFTSPLSRFSKEHGFSLFELILVLTIIGLLLSFSVSAWFSMKTSHRISATASLLANVSQCLETYVIHSGKIPPQAFYISKCSQLDPWGNSLVYETNGDGQQIHTVVSKTFRDESGDHPDAAWVVASFGPDSTRDLATSATMWDCSTGDDLCRTTSKNALYYEITK